MIINSSDYNSWLFIFRLFCVVTSRQVPYWPKENASTFCSMCKNALPWLWWCNFCLSGSILFQFSLEKFRTGLCLFKKTFQIDDDCHMIINWKSRTSYSQYHFKKMPIFRSIFFLLLAFAQVRSDNDCEEHRKALKETKHNLTICNEKLVRLKDEQMQKDLTGLVLIKHGKH